MNIICIAIIKCMFKKRQTAGQWRTPQYRGSTAEKLRSKVFGSHHSDTPLMSSGQSFKHGFSSFRLTNRNKKTHQGWGLWFIFLSTCCYPQRVDFLVLRSSSSFVQLVRCLKKSSEDPGWLYIYITVFKPTCVFQVVVETVLVALLLYWWAPLALWATWDIQGFLASQGSQGREET